MMMLIVVIIVLSMTVDHAVYGWISTTQSTTAVSRTTRTSPEGSVFSGVNTIGYLPRRPTSCRPAQSSRSSSSSSSWALYVAANPPSTKQQQQQQGGSGEQQQGRVLEGGKVIDFSAVKASSRAEEALSNARQKLLMMTATQQSSIASVDDTVAAAAAADAAERQLDHLGKDGIGVDGILGFNQQVIDEVGHHLGTFATMEEIQSCAQYLRSIAAPGILQPRRQKQQHHMSTATTTTVADKTKAASYKALLARAYDEAGEVTGAYAKTFYMGTMLMPEEARKAIWAVYVWCRRTDEIVDAPRDNEDDMLADLAAWEMRLEDLFTYGEVHDVFDLCLLDVRIQYPNLDIVPFRDMIRGMLMDVPDLGQDRYETFDELHLYCYRVAGTVGLMSLPIFGTTTGYTYQNAREPALSLGVAFQLTNILRDVGEDAVERGRVYLPQEDLRRFGVTEDQIFERRVDDNYIRLMEYEISRARMYYERARRGVFMLSESSRLPVQSSLDAYGKILEKIEENMYDNLTKRAYVDKWEKLFTILFSWYRTTDLSRMMPLPGDKPVESLDQV